MKHLERWKVDDHRNVANATDSTAQYQQTPDEDFSIQHQKINKQQIIQPFFLYIIYTKLVFDSRITVRATRVNE